MSDSLSTIFGVVPELMSAWNPEMAPQAIVMKQNGKSGPGIIGPPPLANSVIAGILISGLTMITPMASRKIVPILVNELKYPRGDNRIHTGRIDATNA